MNFDNLKKKFEYWYNNVNELILKISDEGLFLYAYKALSKIINNSYDYLFKFTIIIVSIFVYTFEMLINILEFLFCFDIITIWCKMNIFIH